MKEVVIDNDDPIKVGDRVIVTNAADVPDLVGMAGNVISVHPGGCMNIWLETPIRGYVMAHVRADQVFKSPYQNEPLVAVNNHD